MKIYTKKGDKGKTKLYGGTKISKSHLRIECYGTLDELNSYIGLIRDQKIDKQTSETLLKIQKDLFIIGTILATPEKKQTLKNNNQQSKIFTIPQKKIDFIEKEIDQINEKLPKMNHFILPGGHKIASYCHIARCVCRRAERLVVKLNKKIKIENTVLIYLNRLSDFFFVLARKFISDKKCHEIKWIT